LATVLAEIAHGLANGVARQAAVLEPANLLDLVLALTWRAELDAGSLLFGQRDLDVRRYLLIRSWAAMVASFEKMTSPKGPSESR